MLTMSTPAWAADGANLQILNDVTKQVLRYPHFTIFDSVQAQVDGGVVTLTGRVTMPFKRQDIERRVAKVNGVHTVRDQITVLPVSRFDDQLRIGIARALYGSSAFVGYGSMVNPPIHVIVEHGHVTLEGVVNSDVDRMIARSIANSFMAFSVKSELKTVAEARQERESI
jgi:osmotically-inducible protein OsmY